jgi:HAD superfamily hydrolase (TIGR01490 family)
VHITLFDLDGTITKRDTFVPYLKGLMARNFNTITITPLLVYHLVRFWLNLINNNQLKQIFLSIIIPRCDQTKLLKWTEKYVQTILENNISNDALHDILLAKSIGRVFLVTASIDVYVIPLSKELNIDEVICTSMRRNESGELCGEMLSQNCFGEEKLNRVLEWINTTKYKGSISSYSDHHSDIPLLEFSDNAIAVNPTKELLQYSKKNTWNVVYWQ